MAEIRIYGDIGDNWFGEGLTGESVAQQLEKIGLSEKSVDLRINSYGGITSDGLAIYNQIRSFKAKRQAIDANFKVHGHIDGYAYSAASIIALAADEITMHRGSLFMVHYAWMWTAGNHVDMRKSADYLEKVSAELAKLYAKETGLGTNECDTLMADETFMTGEEAVALGFADHTDDDEPSEDSSKLYSSRPARPQCGYKQYMVAAAKRPHNDYFRSLDEIILDYNKLLIEAI